jgi:hypothetical protein
MPEGNDTVEQIGYRSYVGGFWDQLGQLQFDFLKKQGLRPSDVLLDIACGSLRGGRFFIPYLDRGNYLGIDKEPSLVEAGRKYEVTPEVWTARMPEILINDSFEFEKLSRRPTFALAQSLFSHLEPDDIERCLARLFPVAESGCRFFATFFESNLVRFQLRRSHSFRNFRYTSQQMSKFGENQGWKTKYIGNWDHPKRQKMMLYIKP